MAYVQNQSFDDRSKQFRALTFRISPRYTKLCITQYIYQISHEVAILVTLHIKIRVTCFGVFYFICVFTLLCVVCFTDYYSYNIPSSCIHTANNYDNTFFLSMFTTTEAELYSRCLATNQQRRIIR